jgi:hypothetical protein
MANFEQLKILKDSIDAWNQWRHDSPDLMVDLHGADLPRAYLRGANLEGADLSGADLNGADLSRANLEEADLSRANLRTAYLDGANLRGAYLDWADLSRANLEGADLSNAILIEANLRLANLRQASLRGASLRGANLTGANLEEAIREGTEILDAISRITSEGSRRPSSQQTPTLREGPWADIKPFNGSIVKFQSRADLTPQYLMTRVVPYLNAISRIQEVIANAQGRLRKEVLIESITRNPYVEVKFDWGAEAYKALRDEIVPWRRKNLEALGKLREDEKRAEIAIERAEMLEEESTVLTDQADAENVEAEALKLRAEAQKIAVEAAVLRAQAEKRRLDNERLTVQLQAGKIDLALKVLAAMAPNLSETDKIAYAVNLLPPIDVVITSELEPVDPSILP